uniref:Uncharacterized protein n=1 Tax=Arundo donax TaxID=35708 RepID=A0A0A8Z0M8_ARUDO
MQPTNQRSAPESCSLEAPSEEEPSASGMSTTEHSAERCLVEETSRCL